MAQLSNRYATAIYDLSMESGAINENLNQALLVRDVLTEDDRCHSIITHPRITAAEKRSFFNEIFEKHISKDLMGFLHLAIAKNREAFIVPALESFIDMAHEYLKETTATVVTAVPLRDEQVSALAALLSQKTAKKVTIEQKLDPAIIGGLYIQVDGYFVDRTIKTRLQEIKISLETEK